jgi:ElaB/YqjD/DUF883 family membrane-anchored ribosome-binding protein
MPPRENELPEGTDHIINGAMETGAGVDGSAGGGASSGFIGSGGSGGAAAATGAGTSLAPADGDESGRESGGVADQLRSQAYSLRDQGIERARDFAQGGKTRASDALEELSRVFADTADTIDERLGRDYGEYARKAADAVSGFADTIRRKEVDEIYENVTDAVRKSPGVAIGVAAVVGFALARVVKSGLDGQSGTGSGRSGGTGA